VAVLSVVGYHALPNQIPGGFVGVDVFFVISGFLISNVIFKELENRTFSFADFYSRRIKRIFPALLLMLSACYAAGWFLLLAPEYKELAKHIASSSVFISNFILWREAGYFDRAAELKPLLHLWSLGVEEQFYLFWPLILVAVFRRRRAAFSTILTVLIVSFSLSVLCVKHRSMVFYLPVFRFWELLTGCMLSYLPFFDGRAVARASAATTVDRWRLSICSFLGLASLAASIAMLRPYSIFPGWWAMLPTIGSCLIIYAGPGAWVNRNVLARPAVVFVGLVSYPLYLWHWPILAFLRIVGASSLRTRIVGIVCSFVLATFTFYFVERPIRTSRTRRFAIPKMLLLLGASWTAIGGLTFYRDGFPRRFPEVVTRFTNLNYDFESDARIGRCWLSRSAAVGGYASECAGQEGGSELPLILVWGDSHAGRLYPGIKRLQARESFRLAEYTRDACPPILGAEYKNCQDSNSFVLDQIRKLKPQTVILFAVWNDYEYVNVVDTILAVKRAGVPSVLVIGPAPQWENSLPRSLYQYYLKDSMHRIPYRMSLGLVGDVPRVDISMKELVSALPATYVSLWNLMCNDNGCVTRLDERGESIVSWDYGHLTTLAAEYVAERLPLSLALRNRGNVP
jgi:peptidoglycan/LPS O-acetylase OafA/YrhL